MTHNSATRKPASRQSGFSLIEIMVALVLGLLLLLGVTQVYLSSKASYRTNDGLARIQENGRFVNDLLGRTIRMAGYQGCRPFDDSDINIVSKNDTSIEAFMDGNAIAGFNDVPSPNVYDARAGSDVIELGYFAPVPTTLDGDADAGSSNLKISGNPTNIVKGDIVVITDCENADIFTVVNEPGSGSKVTLTHSKGKNTSNNLSNTYNADDSALLHFHRSRYYIGTASPAIKNTSGDTIYTLYEQPLTVSGANHGGPVPVVDGIEAMEILYARDTNDDRQIDDYQNADGVTDFSQVLAIRIATLVNSIDPALTENDTATYDLADVTGYDPGNSRLLRKPFTLTATIRNRVLPNENP